ncbi:MAG: IclR family transcriptional regulator [candidate division NC10 bacterium]|nr:IclR family transcriptional regulator [candidate division NC10 bacterium]
MGRRRNGERQSETVQSVVRALTLLDALGDSRGEVGVAELSKRVGLHVSTAHRLLATLVVHGYARQNPDTGRYALGAKAFHLAESYLAQMDLRRVVRPGLERLGQETGETANLVVRDGREALYLDKVETPQSLRIFSRIGRRAPLHCTAVGKVILADKPKAEVDALLGHGPLEALTKHTVTSIPQLRRELLKIRGQGYALDREECEEGGCCIAAPLRNASCRVEAALSVSGPTLRLTPARLEELIPIVCRIAREVSAQLGCAAVPS